ncbi:MAG: hypothetical protein AAF721_20595 [Myxococcota bacterium]
MLRTGLLATAACLTLGFASGSASAAEPVVDGAGACSAQLSTLEDKQGALSDLKAAQSEGEANRKELRATAFDLTVQIETLKSSGGSEAAIRSLQTKRSQAVSDVKRSERLAPILAVQIAALTPDVDAASRKYITCVESSLAQ